MSLGPHTEFIFNFKQHNHEMKSQITAQQRLIWINILLLLYNLLFLKTSVKVELRLNKLATKLF